MSIRCPMCGRWFEQEESSAMPFCSSRCRSVDLGRWLKESYGLPQHVEEEEEEEWDEERR